MTGVEPTLVALAATLESEAFEIACEDARRRRLTSVPALNAYLTRFGRAGRPGVGNLRRLLRELDPTHPFFRLDRLGNETADATILRAFRAERVHHDDDERTVLVLCHG